MIALPPKLIGRHAYVTPADLMNMKEGSMSDKHNTDYGNQNAQDARNAETAKAKFDKAGDQTAEHGKQFAEAAREGANKMVDVSEKAAETTKQAMQNGIEIASQEVREAADRFSKTLGFS